MAFKKKTWVDRMVEYAGRRKITNVTTMAAQIVDVERAEGVVSEEGTAINAVNMNDLEQRTADAFSAVQQDIEGINSDLGGNRFGFTADGQPGYKKAGADTVYPFKGPLKIPYMTLSAGNKTFLPLDATGYKNLSFSFASKHPIMKFWIYGSSKMPTSREELLGTEIYFKEAEAVDYKGTVNLDISAYNCVTLYIIPTVDYVIGAIYIDNFVMQ